MTTHVDQLLDIDQVAEELHATRLQVLRLIARSVLPAKRLGESSSIFRITAEDVINYVEENCPDLELPEIDAQRGWFAWQPAGRPNALGHDLVKLAVDDGQRLTDEYLERWRNYHHGQNTLRVELRITEAMRTLWEAPLPKPLVRIKGRAPRPRIVTNAGGEVLATGLLDTLARAIAREPIRATTTPRTKAERLYESRDIYAALTESATKDLLDGDIATHRETRPIGILKAEVHVVYALRYRGFTNAAELKRLVLALL